MLATDSDIDVAAPLISGAQLYALENLRCVQDFDMADKDLLFYPSEHVNQQLDLQMSHTFPLSQPTTAVVLAGSRGIGGATVEALVARGVLVHTFSRSGRGPKLQPGAINFAGDLSSPADLQSFAEEVARKSSRIDILVNGCGHAPIGSLDSLEDSDWQVGFDLLFLSVIRSSRLFLPLLRKATQSAVIVNISSFAVIQPDRDFPISSILRLALTNFAKAFAAEHAGEGIRMVNVLPGFVDSYPMKPERLARIPTGAYATAVEIGQAIAALTSDDMSYINGTDILIDGGLIAAAGRHKATPQHVTALA